MIARGALGNPWLFRSLCENRNAQVSIEEYTNLPSPEERITVLKEHYSAAVEEFGEYAGVRIMRKHVGWYIKGMRGAAALRRQVNEMDRAEEVCEVLDSLVDSFKDEGL